LLRSTTQRRRSTWKECGLVRATTSTVIAAAACAYLAKGLPL
jgi:hypothetical protein